MEYSIKTLCEQYTLDLMKHKSQIRSPIMPDFDLNAYTDYEYISCILDINNAFSAIDDMSISEKFIKGE